MTILDFIKNKIGLKPKSIEKMSNPVDTSSWTGQDFEFLIVGNIDVYIDFDNIMTPNSFEWYKTVKNDCQYYQIGQDEYSYSIEEPGIQMTFNKEITFEKAKKIADEVIENINASGQVAELLILDNKQTHHFDSSILKKQALIHWLPLLILISQNSWF